MPGYRCINNEMGYCQDPGRRGRATADCSDISHAGVFVLQDLSPTSCTLDPRNCGFFITWHQECQALEAKE
jgi:hypothetical protein